MARRRRRAPKPRKDSEADEPAVRHYKEASILKPVNPTTHSDNWPCFLLTDASVYLPNGILANQLEVDLEGPFVVRGRLEVEKDNERYLLDRNIDTSHLWIQIDRSTAFSVGCKDDSLAVPVVWASGLAGWFEIVPSPRYQHICNQMFQAVRLHYSLSDQYDAALEELQKSRKKKKATLADVPLDLDELLFQYALRSGEGLTCHEAYQRLDSHKVFLMSHFPKDTTIYSYLLERFSSLRDILAQDLSTRMAAMEAVFGPCTLEAYDYSGREKSSSLEITGVKRFIGRLKSSAPRSKRNSEAVADAEVAHLPNRSQGIHSSGSSRGKKRSPADISLNDNDAIMADQPSNAIVAPPRKPHKHQGENDQDSPIGNSSPIEKATPSGLVLIDALEDVRRQMLQLISQGKQKKSLHQITAKSWRTRVYMECSIKAYNSVEEIFRYYAKDLAQRLSPEWHDTTIYQWVKDNSSKPVTLTLISETEIKQIVRRVKKSARAAGAETKVINEDSQPNVREYAGEQTPRGRLSGKAAGLRPSTGGKKRLRHELSFEDDMDLDEDGSLKKKPKTPQYLTQDEDEEDEDNNGSIDEDDTVYPGHDKAYAENDGSPTAHLVIRAEKLPSTQPHGPNQTWICEEPECGYVVRDACEEDGQKLIQDHFEEHEKVAQDLAEEMAVNRVDLAKKEARGHMPINHLLEKIRTISEKSARRDEVHINGHRVSEPIKRTLLI